jgi:HPt (histidine-containing phosphotransfer) domain-containing protein
MLVFDRAHFDHMTAGDRALQAEVLELFRTQIEQWTRQIAVGGNWREAVHTLKGSARGIGLAKLAGACEACERADAAAAPAAIADIRAALSEALAELERFAADAG